MDIPFGRADRDSAERERSLQINGRRQHVEGIERRFPNEWFATKALGQNSARGRTFECEGRLRHRRMRDAAERALPIRRWRQDLDGSRQEPKSDLASVLLFESYCRSEE